MLVKSWNIFFKRINWNWRFGQLPWNSTDNIQWNNWVDEDDLQLTILEAYFDFYFNCASDNTRLKSFFLEEKHSKIGRFMQKIYMFMIDDHYHQEKISKERVKQFIQ
jgi:hypothetical protein